MREHHIARLSNLNVVERVVNVATGPGPGEQAIAGPSGIAAIQALGEQNDFRVDASEDAAIFNDKSLAQYRVVVFLNTTGDIFNSGEQVALEKFVRRGVGARSRVARLPGNPGGNLRCRNVSRSGAPETRPAFRRKRGRETAAARVWNGRRPATRRRESPRASPPSLPAG